MSSKRTKRAGRPTYTTGVKDRLCSQCGGVTRGVTLCAYCFERSPAGKADAAYRAFMKKYEPLADGGPCVSCTHWCGSKCGLGFPEAGSPYAVDCPALIAC